MSKKSSGQPHLEYEIGNSENEFNITPVLKPTIIKGEKAVKYFKKSTATIKIDDHIFDANEESINFMSSVLVIANFRFNKLVNSGKTRKEAYKKVYEDTVVWKDAKNEWVEVKISNIADALELAMENMKEIISDR